MAENIKTLIIKNEITRKNYKTNKDKKKKKKLPASMKTLNRSESVEITDIETDIISNLNPADR